MEKINFLFDVVLILCSLWMVMVVRGSGLGGAVGNGLQLITFGAIVLGMAHLSETLTFEVFHLQNMALGEFLHRIIIVAGFVLLTLGFQQFVKLRRA